MIAYITAGRGMIDGLLFVSFRMKWFKDDMVLVQQVLIGAQSSKQIPLREALPARSYRCWYTWALRPSARRTRYLAIAFHFPLLAEETR